MLSTVFDKKVCFHVSKLKKCRTKSVISRDFLRLAFNLFQEENGTFFPISFWLLQSFNGIAYDDIRHSRLFSKWNTWRMIIEYPSNIEKYFESFEIINSLCWLPNAYIFSDLKTIACAATGKQVSNRKQSSEKLFADYVKKFSILTYDVSQIYDSTVIHYDYPLFEVFADLKRAYCWTWTFMSNRCRIQKMLSFWGVFQSFWTMFLDLRKEASNSKEISRMNDMYVKTRHCWWNGALFFSGLYKKSQV